MQSTNDKNDLDMKPLLRQIRNEWRTNLFLFVELLLVFTVLWYIVDEATVTARVYTAPMGYDVEHCYTITVDRLTSKSLQYNPDLTAEDDVDALLEIAERLRHRPGVEAVALSQNCKPYNEGANNYTFYLEDSIAVTQRLYWVQPDFYRVFRYRTADGGGPEALADATVKGSMVITSNVAAEYEAARMPDAAPLLGKEVPLSYPDRGYHLRVGAIAAPVRRSRFDTSQEFGGPFIGVNLSRENMVDIGLVRALELSVRVRPDADRDFAESLLADADRQYRVGNLFLLDAHPFSDLRYVYELEDTNELKTRLCVLIFLLVNIFLGVIGTFWFRTQQRRQEVALRMAMGSPRRAIFGRLMTEGLLLLTLAALPAALIAFNIGYGELVDVSKLPFDAFRFFSAILLTWLLMAAMIVTGIWYPARRAMKLQPAEALYDE